MKLRRARCPECTKDFGVKPPKGGDGSADVFPRHNNKAHNACDGSRQVVEDDDYLAEDEVPGRPPKPEGDEWFGFHFRSPGKRTWQNVVAYGTVNLQHYEASTPFEVVLLTDGTWCSPNAEGATWSAPARPV